MGMKILRYVVMEMFKQLHFWYREWVIYVCIFAFEGKFANVLIFVTLNTTLAILLAHYLLTKHIQGCL